MMEPTISKERVTWAVNFAQDARVSVADVRQTYERMIKAALGAPDWQTPQESFRDTVAMYFHCNAGLDKLTAIILAVEQFNKTTYWGSLLSLAEEISQLVGEWTEIDRSWPYTKGSDEPVDTSSTEEAQDTQEEQREPS